MDGNELMTLDDNITGTFSNYLYIPFEKNDNGEIIVSSVRLAFEGDVTVEANLYDDWEGDGTAESPYIIYTTGQLIKPASSRSLNVLSQSFSLLNALMNTP